MSQPLPTKKHRRKPRLAPSQAHENTINTFFVVIILQLVVFLGSHFVHIMHVLNRVFYNDSVPLLGEYAISVRNLAVDWLWLFNIGLIAYISLRFDEMARKFCYAIVHAILSVLCITYFVTELTLHVMRFPVRSSIYSYPLLYYFVIIVEGFKIGLMMLELYPFWKMSRYMHSYSKSKRE